MANSMLYAIDRIVNSRRGDDGKMEYLVQWTGYEAQDSWVHERDMFAKQAIRDYELDLKHKMAAQDQEALRQCVRRIMQQSHLKVSHIVQASSCGCKPKSLQEWLDGSRALPPETVRAIAIYCESTAFWTKEMTWTADQWYVPPGCRARRRALALALNQTTSISISTATATAIAATTTTTTAIKVGPPKGEDVVVVAAKNTASTKDTKETKETKDTDMTDLTALASQAQAAKPASVMTVVSGETVMQMAMEMIRDHAVAACVKSRPVPTNPVWTPLDVSDLARANSRDAFAELRKRIEPVTCVMNDCSVNILAYSMVCSLRQEWTELYMQLVALAGNPLPRCVFLPMWGAIAASLIAAGAPHVQAREAIARLSAFDRLHDADACARDLLECIA